MKISKNYLLLSLIFLLGLCLRLYGLNWDQSQHLHPDERFLTMVVNDISLPSSVSEYFNTKLSPLNPFNYQNYQFFVYGTLPLFLNKLVAIIFDRNTYDGITQTGRVLSALFDSFNIILLFLLVKKTIKNRFFTILPSLLYAFTVLPLQLSHFFAVDTFLSFFLLAAFTALAYGLFYPAAFLFGLALACKVSAVIFVPVIGLFFLQKIIKTKKIYPLLLTAVICLLIAFCTFRVFQPYAFSGTFTINPKFTDSLKTLRAYDKPDIYFPPAVQWISKTKFLFPLKNLGIWGLGLPLTFFFFFVVAKFIQKQKLSFFKNPDNQLVIFSLFWILFLFSFQSLQFTYAMRYFLPIYPHIIFVVAVLASRLRLNPKITLSVFAFHLLGGLAFLNIYSFPHSRVEASIYIYTHLPPGSVITNEYWDDPLPLYLPGYDPNVYQGIMLPLYDPDSPEKWASLIPKINSADYLIMSSNRLWGSIPKVPNRYPQTSNFYRDLFDGRQNFTKKAEFNSYPGFNLSVMAKCLFLGPTDYPSSSSRPSWVSWESCSRPGIYFRDDTADESFTVYDHPKVLIFKSRQK